MDKATINEYIALLRREVVPALGCTEPVAVAFAAAKAAQALGTRPETIEVELSGNLLKNGMGVGVPGTGMTGLPIAAAVGALGGNPEAGLETLKDITPAHVAEAKKMLDQGRVTLSSPHTEPIYVAVTVNSKDQSATAVVRGSHTNVVLIKKNGNVIWEQSNEAPASQKSSVPMSLKSVYAFATTAPVEDLAFILEGKKLNMAIAREGLAKDYGLRLGKTIQANISKKLLADDVSNYALMLTAAAIDARMDGAMLPVMSNSGSGDQGLVCTLPVVAFAERLEVSEEQLIRALTLCNLTAIHIKAHMGRLSALCGTIVAATGACCGIVMLLGGGYAHMGMAVSNMVGSISGMICDGAKNSCALKGNSAVSAAITSAFLALANQGVTGTEGIVDEDVERSIQNLGRITVEAMPETDKVILDIMVKKVNH